MQQQTPRAAAAAASSTAMASAMANANGRFTGSGGGPSPSSPNISPTLASPSSQSPPTRTTATATATTQARPPGPQTTQSDRSDGPRASSSSSAISPSATAAAQRKASHSSPHGLNARSCVTCRRRKVKCDKQVPCSNCTKAGSECVFPAPGRAPRRPRQPGTKVVGEREAELLKRLRRLEGVVEELSGQVELETAVKASPAASDASSPPLLGAGAGAGTAAAAAAAGGGHRESGEAVEMNHIRAGKVVVVDEAAKRKWLGRNFRMGMGPPKTAFTVEGAAHGMGKLVLEDGRSRYVSSPFWTSVSEEVEEIKEMLEEQDFDSDSDTPIGPSSDLTKPDHQAFILGYSSSDVSLKKLHPLPSQISFYWQTFLENVQPLSMLLHPPSMTPTIKEAMSNVDSLTPSAEALMFSIYFATITSMSHDEVITNLGVEKQTLLKQYRFAIEQALSKASFLSTTELTTVQALTLFLICVRRHDDTGYMWALTGLALRIAQSLGLHRDGAKLGLPPFETEMRRRLWWQIVMLDVRSSEDHGTDVALLNNSYDTEFPLALDDDALTPGMTETPVVKPGASAMTFCLIRYEICVMMAKVNFSPLGTGPLGKLQPLTVKEKEDLISAHVIHMEKTYLQYCENSGPLNWVGATVTRLVSNKMLLMLYHPFSQPGNPSVLANETRDRLFMASIQVIEFARSLETEPSTKQWGWMLHTYMQWHAIAYILGELGDRDSSPIVDRAWRAMDSLFNDWGEIMSKSGLLWHPLRKLMARARRRRQQNLQMLQNAETGINGQYNRLQSLNNTQSPRAFSMAQQDPSAGLASSSNNTSTMNGSSTMGPPTYGMSNDASMLQTQPESMGMGMGLGMSMSENQVPSYGQQSGLQQQALPSSWIMDDSNNLLDIDMSGLEGDVSWHGWDDLVRDFQLETDSQLQDTDMAKGPVMGGIGNWW